MRDPCTRAHGKLVTPLLPSLPSLPASHPSILLRILILILLIFFLLPVFFHLLLLLVSFSILKRPFTTQACAVVSAANVLLRLTDELCMYVCLPVCVFLYMCVCVCMFLCLSASFHLYLSLRTISRPSVSPLLSFSPLRSIVVGKLEQTHL